MAAHVTTSQVQAWLETTKLTVSALDANLETQVSSEVLSKLQPTFPTQVPNWVDTMTTPVIVQQIISMMYAGWFYDLKYAEVNPNGTTYGATLRNWALSLISDILLGNVMIAELGALDTASQPAFYPNDVSSTTQAWLDNTDTDDVSLGPAKFGMGKVF